MKEEEKRRRWEEKSKSAWREGGEQEEESVHLAPHISKEDDRGDRTRGEEELEWRGVWVGGVGGGGVVCCRSRQTSGWVNRLMGVRGGEGRWGKGWGERHRCCCAGGNSAVWAPSRDPGPICWWDWRIYVLFTRTSPGPRIPPTPLLHPLLRSPISTSPRCLQTSLTNPLLHPPTLSHPLPSSPALQALYLALISLSLKPSPCSPASFTPTATPSSLSFSSLSICLSLSLSPSFHSPPPLHRSYPLGLCTAARLMRGRISLPVLWSYESWYPEQSCRSRHWAPWHLNDMALCRASVRGPFPYSLPAGHIKSRQVELAGIEPIIPERLYGNQHVNLGNMQLVGINWFAFTQLCRYRCMMPCNQ